MICLASGVFVLGLVGEFSAVTNVLAQYGVDEFLLGSRMDLELRADLFDDRRVVAALEFREELLNFSVIVLQQSMTFGIGSFLLPQNKHLFVAATHAFRRGCQD
jgi:hypothetical protein